VCSPSRRAYSEQVLLTYRWYLSILWAGRRVPLFILLAIKSVWQYYAPSREVLVLLDVFRRMINDSIRIGLVNDVSSLRRISLLSYSQLADYDSPSCYRLCAISRAAGILAARKKSIKRGFPTRQPYAFRAQLVSCYGFKAKNGGLEIAITKEASQAIPDQAHVRCHLSTGSQGSLFHPHPEQAEPMHRPRRCPSRVRVYRRRRP